MSVKKPLEGIRVVEFATFVAAASAGRLFSDLGAEVIRVESMSGDPWRFYGKNCGIPTADGENPLFDIYNTNKRDILVDVKKPEGREVLMRLLENADVLITNNRVKALKRLGLDYDSIKDRFPRLIYALLTGYGQEGPDVDAPGYDGVAFFSRSGLLADMAEPGGYPANAPGCVGDAATGSALFGAICAALYSREKTGRGEMLEISLFGNAVWLCGTLTAFEQYGYHYPKKRLEMAPLYTFYRCKDGEWIQLAITQVGKYWKPLLTALKREELGEDPRFLTPDLISRNRALLVPLLEEAFSRFDSEEISARLREQDIVYDRMRHYREIASDSQATSNGFVQEHNYESGHRFMMPMTPVRWKYADRPHTGVGPAMGQHTREILEEYGYRAEEIDHLEKSGAVREYPRETIG